MAIVKYTDDNGYWKVADVPDDVTPDKYHRGVQLGPPDLSGLELPVTTLRELYERLVQADLYIAPQLMGKRAQLRQILKSAGVSIDLLGQVINKYQERYYTGEREDE